jgi:putative ABC transport system permease protein
MVARIGPVRAVTEIGNTHENVRRSDRVGSHSAAGLDALAAKRSTQSAFSGLFVGLAGVALLVGGIGVANTMVISVLERRREIGLRRALGASRGHIRIQFLAESVALSSLCGLAGVVLGAAATVTYAAYQAWPLVIPVPAALSSLLGAGLVGILAGVFPAVRAARLPPTEALSAT